MTQRQCDPPTLRERGVALMAVIVVLLALIAIATPFALSMRNQDRTAAVLTARTQVNQSIRSAMAMAEEALSASDPQLDDTPHFDSADELSIRLPREADRFGIDANDPQGTIWSVRTEDAQGRVDVNHVSPFLLGSLLDGRTTLASDLEADEALEIRVESTAGMPDIGLLWIEGEIVLYRSKTLSTFNDIEREFSTSVLLSHDKRSHLRGVPVLDYRVILATVYPYKIHDREHWTGFPSVRAIKDIARFDELGYTADELDRVEADLTAHAVVPGQRFHGAARAIYALSPQQEVPEVILTEGRNIGAGTVVRISAGDRVEYNLVASARESGPNRVRLLLQEPVRYEYGANEAIVEGLARAPVNVNTCSKRVLRALFEGVQAAGRDRLSRGTVDLLVKRILEARPIEGEPHLGRILKDMSTAEELTPEEHLTVLYNAMNPMDATLAVGTAPLTYQSYGLFELHAAASENLPVGREAARLFARMLAQVFPAGRHLTFLNSQLDFNESMRLSRTGKFWTTFPENVLEHDRHNQPPLPVESFADHGRFPQVESDEEPYARLAPMRKDGLRDEASEGQGRIIHFDESARSDAARFNSANQDGWDVQEYGPLDLPVDGFHADLLDGRGWVRPFCLEMWWQPNSEGSGGETYLFDTGQDDLFNRIYAYHDGNTLYFRVADASEPDGGGGGVQAPAEYPTLWPEIRYEFEDGLPFEDDVPYHLTFYARGSKPSDMVLLIDGVPRGRRAFQTRLTGGLSAPLASTSLSSIPGYQTQDSTIPVDDAELFPSYGVVRVGNELIEYTSKSDDALVAQPFAGDAFGGRARRGSIGDDHFESEAVELYGYAAILVSDRIPTGDTQLGSPLGEFGVAMVNPDQVTDPIYWDTGGFGDVPMGRGLVQTETTIPLTALAKPGAGSAFGSASGDISTMFSRDGGFALIVSSPLWPPSNRASLNFQPPGQPDAPETTFGWTRPFPAVGGGVIGASEMIYYDSFDGSRLTGVRRSGPSFFPSMNFQPVANMDVANNASVIDQAGIIPHAHISRWNFSDGSHDQVQPIFVVPISVTLGAAIAAGANDFAIPEEIGQSPGVAIGGATLKTRPEILQLGAGFGSALAGGTGGGGTEWVRYDSIAQGSYVRDHPGRLRTAALILGRYLTEKYTMQGSVFPTADLVARAINHEAIAAKKDEGQEIASDLGIDPALLGNALAFRGVLGTGDKEHGQGERVLPVFRTFRQGEIHAARPGARDFVTIVDPTTNLREEHRVNYGYCIPDVENWGGLACHIAFEAGVKGNFTSNFAEMFSQVDPEDSGAAMDALANQNIESRDLTRILKFPSGELPTEIGEQLYVGGDFRGEASPAGGIFDEVEFFTPATPSPNLPRHPRYILSRDDDFSGRIYLRSDSLRYNLWTRGGVVIDAIDPVSNLPEDGVVLLLDDELIAISDIVVGDNESELEVAVNGRGFLGTPIQYHPVGTSVREIGFLRVSRLERDLAEDGIELEIADAQDFDYRGVIHVGRELIGYTHRDGNKLLVPPWRDETGRDTGLLRGSFGSEPEAHAEGALVYQFPARFQDRFRPRAEDPALGYLGGFVKARGAYFTEVTWDAENVSDLVDLVVQARVGGRGLFTDDPTTAADIFQFDQPGSQGRKNQIMRQGDDLEIRVFVRYKEGAFDTTVFDPDPGEDRGGSNDWKRAPRLKGLGVEWIAGSSRIEYEEWR